MKDLLLDEHIGFDNIPDGLAFMEFLDKECIQLSQIGVSARVLDHWEKSGLVNPKKTAENRYKYTLTDYVWLNIIKDLREYGLSLEKIKKVKEALCRTTIAYSDIITEIKKAFEDERNGTLPPISEERRKAVTPYVDMLNAGLTAVMKEQGKGDDIEKAIINLVESDTFFKTKMDIAATLTPLKQRIIWCLFQRIPYIIVVDMDADVYAIGGTEIALFPSSELAQKSVIWLPLTKYLSQFIADEKNLKSLGVLPLINENEQEVLILLRSGAISELKVKLGTDKKTITLLEATEKNVPIQAFARLSDIIAKGGYEVVSYKTQNGKIVSFDRTTLKKL